jgi:hypothetical protein|tara:strand:+ start:126 stop:527 length:402 start_codon:yes stop_codon:yes gene_type:complete
MAWYDTKSTGSTMTATEWNNMVTYIRRGVVTAQTSTTLTLDLNHDVIVGDTTSNVIAITLPEAADSLGKRYTVFLETDGGNDLTVACAGSDVFNSSSNTLATFADAEDYFEIVAVSNNRWLIISENGVAYSTP